MSSPYQNLFKPIRLGSVEAKNRIMRAATTSNLADANRVGLRQIAFYEAVAKGGAGVIVTESMRMFPGDTFPAGAIAIHERDALPGLRKLTATCHKHGAMLIGQLNTAGRQHTSSRVPGWMIAPSAIACPRSGGIPHELSTREVREVVDTFVTCAVNCMEAGMDGVEIHGAQGHLIQQFLSPFTNRRTDAYGGSFDNRLRFAREILGRTRERLGSSAVIGYRMGAEEFTEGGLGIEETLAIAKELCRNGLVDYLSLAQGIFNTIETHLPDRHWPAPAYKDLHARFKAAVPHVAVITSSRIQTPEQAEAIIANGEADMVAMCRALVVDPEWAEKARKGHSDRIRKCIACNQCWGWISAGEPIACATNPVAGREWRWKPIRKSKVRKRVIVVGGGPAGLEAARVAAFSGHDVTLLEREAGLGGRMRGVSLIPHHAEMAHLLDFLVPETRRAGARIETGHTASAESILALAPDAIVIATGSTAETPEIASDNSVPVRTADGPVELAGLPGENVVLVDDDGYYWASAVAESLVASGRRITIATRFFEPFREIPITSRIVLLREMDAAGASLRANTTVASASNGAVSLRHVMTGRSETIPDVAAIFWTGLARANGSLAADLIAKGFDKSRLHVVGDAFSPRRLAHALTEAHAAARAIASSPGT